MNRSINVELELEAGDYVVVVKIDALRNEQIMPVEDVIRASAKERREKLLRIGFAYDLAHSKGRIIETPEEKAARENYEKKKRDRERKRMAKLLMKQKEEERKHTIRQTMKKKKAAEKARARAKARDERRQARKEAKEKAEEEQKKDKGEEGADKPSEETTAMAATTAPQPNHAKGEGKLESKGSGSQEVPGDKMGARLEITCDDKSVAEGSRDGTDSSTEPGENTPASSTMFERTPVEAEETQEEDAYVTAAEEEGESQPAASMEASTGEEPPPTPKASQPKPERAVPKPSADKARRPYHNHVDIGVQTGPGLPLPPRTPGPPPGYIFSPPPPPPPRGSLYGPPRGQRHHLPPHLRAVPYTSPPPPPPPGASSSYTSDATTDDGIDDLDSMSEVSEHEIDLYLEAQGKARAAAARAAKANQPSSPPPPSGPTCEDELNEFEKDPWNAVGVFGLRVYYRSDSGGGGSAGASDEQIVKLRVERPNPWMWEDDSDGEADDEKEKMKGDDAKEAKEEANESQVLDIDDSGKDAVAENITAQEKEEDEKALEGEASAQTTRDEGEAVKKAGDSEKDSSKYTEIDKEPGKPKVEHPDPQAGKTIKVEAGPEKTGTLARASGT